MRRLFFGALVLSLLLWASAAWAESTAVMVYLCGSNLESLYGSATKDIQEMLLSGLDAKETQVFIMTGGSREWMDGTISAEETRIYTLSAKAHGSGLKMKLVDSTSSRNMGEAETLSYFLHFCAEYGEADRRALILWDHGGGPVNGVCWDENFGTDHLSLEEITAALSQSPFAQDKLEWIGFDACLMSSVEVASKLSPYAKYMISSQAEEPASGWDYSFLKGLENDAGGGATGARIVEAYFAVEQKYAADRTLSCVDLSAIAQIEESMNEMYAGMAARLNRDTFSALSKLRFKATGYGKSAAAKVSNGYDLVDIASLTESYATLDPEGAEAVKEAVQRAVLCNRSNVPGSSGLSVYHPYRNQNRFTSEWRDNYAQLGFCPGYTAYVNAYGQIMTGGSLTRWSGLNDIQAAADGSLVTLNLTQEQAENLSSARLIVLARNFTDPYDDAYFRVFSTVEVSQSGTLLSASYDGTSLMAINEGANFFLSGATSYRVTEDGLYQVDLYPYDENGQRADTPIVAEYRMNGKGQLELKNYAVFDDIMGTFVRRADVDLSQYPNIGLINQYRVPTANAAGEWSAFDDWNEDAHRDKQTSNEWTFGDTGFQLVFSPDRTMGEDLYAAYELTDTQGNTYMTGLTPLMGGGVDIYEAEITLPEGMAGASSFGVSGTVVARVTKESFLTPQLFINLMLENKTESSFLVKISYPYVNGVKTKAYALDDSYYRHDGYFTLAPHGKCPVAMVMYDEELASLGPHTELKQIDLSLYLYSAPLASLWDSLGGKNAPKVTLPVRITAQVPLTFLHFDADALPPEDQLLSYGFTSQPLLTHGDNTLSMVGMFTVDRSLVLLLQADNKGDGDWDICLGQAQLDGQEARIGRTAHLYTQMRNSAVRFFGLDMPLWQEQVGAWRRIPAGKRQFFYVSVAPLSPAQTQAQTLFFRALTYDYNSGSSLFSHEYFDGLTITAQSPIPLEEGRSVPVPAAEYAVAFGQPVERRNTGVLSDSVWTRNTQDSRPILLTAEAPEGEQFYDAYYALFRRVRSKEEMAALNIVDTGSYDTEQAYFSFAGGQEWLIYEVLGQAQVADDGLSLSALYPGLRPVLCTGKESMPLLVNNILTGQDGRIHFYEVNDLLLFTTGQFPNHLSHYGAAVHLSYDRRTDAAVLEDYTDNGAYDFLGDMVFQFVHCIPLNASSGEIAQFLNDDTNLYYSSPRQFQHLYGGPAQYGIEAVDNPEDYLVTFWYANRAGEVKCTPLRPLTDFLPAE